MQDIEKKRERSRRYYERYREAIKSKSSAYYCAHKQRVLESIAERYKQQIAEAIAGKHYVLLGKLPALYRQCPFCHHYSWQKISRLIDYNGDMVEDRDCGYCGEQGERVLFPLTSKSGDWVPSA